MGKIRGKKCLTLVEFVMIAGMGTFHPLSQSVNPNRELFRWMSVLDSCQHTEIS